MIVFLVEEREAAPIRLLLKRGENSSYEREAQHAYLGCLMRAVAAAWRRNPGLYKPSLQAIAPDSVSLLNSAEP